MYRFSEAIDIMKHLDTQYETLIKENEELQDVREFQNKRIEELEKNLTEKELTIAPSTLKHYQSVIHEKDNLKIENDRLTNIIKDLIIKEKKMKKMNENTRRNLDHQIDDLLNENKKLKEELNLAEKALKDYHHLYDQANKQIEKLKEELKEYCVIEDTDYEEPSMVKNDTKPSKELNDWLSDYGKH